MDHMEIKSGEKRIFIGGVSEKGVNNKLNQDAFLIGYDKDQDVAYIIVADGLGSCKNSAQGSKRVTEIIENWIKSQLPKYAYLSNNVANIFAKRLMEEWQSSYDIEDINTFDTTVHVAIYYKGSIMIGGIGDGMELINCDDLYAKDRIDHKDLFSNVTNSMCSINAEELLSFEIVSKDSYNNIVTIIIATDGIADDLIPEKKMTLLPYFYDVLTQQGSDAMQSELKEWLKDWETESHSDDKTICYLVVKGKLHE